MQECESLVQINRKLAKKTYTKVGLSLFVLGVVCNLSQIIILLLCEYVFHFSKDFLNSNTGLLILSTITLYFIAYPVGFFMLNSIPTIEYKKEKLRFDTFCKYCIMCVPILYIGNLIGSLLSYFLSNGISQNPLELLEGSNLFLTFIVSCIMAPIFEELIFRKQIIDHVKRFGDKSAIIFSALAFGLFHMNLYQFFYAFGVGLIFGYIYTRTNKIHYSIIIHMIINFFGGILAPFLLSLIEYDGYSGFPPGPSIHLSELLIIYYLFAIIGFSVLGIIILIDERKKFVLQKQLNEEGMNKAFTVKYFNYGVILFVILCAGLTIYSLFI